jgi:hypothetical protein
MPSTAEDLLTQLQDLHLMSAVEEAGCGYRIRAEPQFNQAIVVLRSGVEVGFICAPD